MQIKTAKNNVSNEENINELESYSNKNGILNKENIPESEIFEKSSK